MRNSKNNFSKYRAGIKSQNKLTIAASDHVSLRDGRLNSLYDSLCLLLDRLDKRRGNRGQGE